MSPLDASEDPLLEQLRTLLAPQWTVHTRIGEGGLGIAFRATDATGRVVVIKVLRPDLVGAVGIPVALHELGIAARLSHPHILPILFTGELHGRVYYVTPFIEGGTLRRRLDRDGPLPFEVALRITRDVAEAVSYAHRHQVLHRDINPANVLLQDGYAIVKDFWIARALARALPWAATRLGSRAHMSAEQVRLGDADARSDVYSLGCLVYEMLTGHPPSATDLDAFSTRFGRFVGDLAHATPTVIEAIARALSTAPADRYPTPEHFLDALGAPEPGVGGRPPDDLAKRRDAGMVFGCPEWARMPQPPAGPRDQRRAPIAWLRKALARLFKRRARPIGIRAAPSQRRADEIEHLGAALRYRYAVKRHLSQGGMANVYVAEDLRYPRRKVAIKVLRPELAASIASERFLREIDVTAHLAHPLIVPLFDSGDADGMLFYVMPFLECKSLREAIGRDHRLPLSEVVRIASNVAAALDYAHRKEVVHRDVKPENVLLYEGQALVADFGIALALDRAGTRLTGEGSPGTPQYMSPEQLWSPERIDYRSDQYSLACVVYEMVTGRPPYTGTFQQTAVKHLNAPVPHARAMRSDVPERMDLAIYRALAKQPEDRFSGVQDFASALRGESRGPDLPWGIDVPATARGGDAPSATL